MPLIRVLHGENHSEETRFEARKGDNLRRLLLAHNLSPYTAITKNLNCGGRGICATCGVRVDSDADDSGASIAPDHWHDKLASRFGYPRLSCQITITDDMTVRLVDDKIIWGSRNPERAGT
jgi:ferredoxin